MSDIGIKVSLLGYDAKTAADHNLGFSSSWPLLKLHMSGTTSITDLATEQLIVDHGLGYPPIFIYGSINSLNSVPVSASGDYAELFEMPTQFSISDTSLYYDGFYSGSQPVEIFYRIYRYDLTTNFTAPSSATSGSNQTDVNNDYTIRVSKEGKSVDSTDLRDFAIHSDTRSPMIHQSVYGDLVPTTDSIAGYEVKATHNLRYKPFFLSYYIDPTTQRWKRVPTGTGGAIGAFVNDTSVKIGFASSSYGNAGSVIVFKDPFDRDLTDTVIV